MNESKLKYIENQYQKLRNTDKYIARLNQSRITPVFSAIISETLKNEPLRNIHLTGLIQMFSWKCQPGNFNKYLNGNVKDSIKRQKLLDKKDKIGEAGYTGAGKAAIKKPTPKQLIIIKEFLSSAFKVKNSKQAALLCKKFEENNIPEVTKGIYSIWLHYINPKIFPVANKKYEKFQKWLEISTDYPSFIEAASEIATLVNDDNLGLIDTFIYTFVDPTPDNKIKKNDTESEVSILNPNPTNNMSLNTILFGPPGTGKTYSTVDETLKTLNIDTSSLTRTEAKQKFAEFQKSRRVFFTTFHQNMAYEDFMEGIKPVDPEEDDEFLKYHIQDGLFMQACIEAAFNYIDSNSEQEDFVQELLDFNGLFDRLFERISDAGSEKLKTKSGGKVIATVTSQGNLSFKHSGRDKPYTVSRDRLSRIYELYPEPENIANIQNAFMNAIGGCNATAYWAALNAIAEIRDAEGGEPVKTTVSATELSYLDKRRIVQKYWNKNEYTVQNTDKSLPYVFIIDEINRGNVAQIFGELITLIEEDKRMGKPESISAQLPYSKNYFSVPPNLYILGTMNTADRSVEALDTALRRRFSFVQMLPIPEKLKVTSDGIDLSKILSVLNKRLEILKDCDHMIGHAWFWDVTTIEQLKMVFDNKILPLLQEYFYNDYEKLGLVLGDAFFHSLEQVDSNMFASFTGGNGLAGQYDQAWSYQLKPVSDLTVDDFKTLEHLNHQTKLDEEQ
jgi:hypothetical protein